MQDNTEESSVLSCIRDPEVMGNPRKSDVCARARQGKRRAAVFVNRSQGFESLRWLHRIRKLGRSGALPFLWDIETVVIHHFRKNRRPSPCLGQPYPAPATGYKQVVVVPVSPTISSNLPTLRWRAVCPAFDAEA